MVFRHLDGADGRLVAEGCGGVLPEGGREAEAAALCAGGEDRLGKGPLQGLQPVVERIQGHIEERGGDERMDVDIGLLQPPMRVMARANTHAGNVGQLDELKRILRTRAEQTGVDLDFYPAALVDVSPADDVSNPMFDYAFHSLEVMLRPEMRHIPVGEDHVCNAQNLYMLTMDERGGLYMSGGMACGKDEYVYGSAHDWDPADPIATASKPEMISSYLGTVVTDPSSECYDCPWLPLCGGGCPHLRLFGKHSCPPYKDAPERFVLAMRDRLDKRQGGGPRADRRGA